VDPQPREFERMLATLADASLKPLAARFLHAEGLPAPWVMCAEGGIAPLAEAMARPLGLVGSGPSAGALAAARAAQGEDAIGLDIGSITTEVSLHRAGAPLTARGVWLDEMWLRGAALDVESLRLGGTTRLRMEGGRLRLGRDPSLDGEAATLTDAAVLAGLVSGSTPAQQAAAARACAGLDAASAIRQAVVWLAERVRRIAFRRAIDPAQARLVVGGGAGVFLAKAIAAELGARELRLPDDAAVLAATGLARAPAMARAELACDLSLAELAVLRDAALRQAGTLREKLRGWCVGSPALHHELDLATGPRAEPIALRWMREDDAASLTARFTEAARAQRGQAPPGAPRALALRSVAVADLPPP
jgi:N-methylhydantoinase A